MVFGLIMVILNCVFKLQRILNDVINKYCFINYVDYLCYKYICYFCYLLYCEKVLKVYLFIGVNVIRDGIYFFIVLIFVLFFNLLYCNYFI